MRQSENVEDLQCALVKVQAEHRVVVNESRNPFFNSKYADFATVKAKTDPILTKHGLCVIQGGSADAAPELLSWETINKDGQTVKQFGTWIVMDTRLCHESGQWIECSQRYLVAQPTPQAMGSATSYAKRYGYSAITGVYTSDEDDDGNEGSQRDAKGAPPPKAQPAGKTATEDEVNALLEGL